MGGSGSGSVSPQIPFEILRLRKEAREQADSADVRTAVNECLRTALSGSHRDPDKVGGYLEQIEKALDKEVETERILFGGSAARKTYVEGLSDVDCIVLLKDTDAASKQPAELIEAFATALGGHLPQARVATIKEGNMAVTVTFKDGTEIQLLPAYRVGDGFAVASHMGRKWRATRPKEFAGLLTAANAKLNQQLVPTIKLAKRIISQYSEDRRLSGYHVENLAIEAFKGYTGRQTYKDMLSHFFARAADLVKAPIADPTGQSKSADTSRLGNAGSLERLKAADSLARTARRMATATDVANWEDLLGNV